DRLPAGGAGRRPRPARRRRPVPGRRPRRRLAGRRHGAGCPRRRPGEAAARRAVLLRPVGSALSDLRRELADLVADRGLGLLDAWLGPVETKFEILAVLAAGRNLLLEGPVGSGKTLLGESIAAALPPIRLAGCHFN